MNDYTGQKFTRLLVLGRGKRKQKTNGGVNWLWKCQCDCGNIREVVGAKLRLGLTKSCGCFKSENVKPKFRDLHHSWSGYKEITGSLICRIKANAKSRNISFTVSNEYLWKLFLNQEGRCKLSGAHIVFAKNSKELKEGFNTASLDRIDSTKGYIKSNVQWIHVAVNYMKREYNQSEFLAWCESITEYQQKK